MNGPARRTWGRVSHPSASEDRLLFAQVREDPLLEIEALALGPADTAVVVSSGGCTALSLVAAGAGQVVAVDLNKAQNNLVELKAAAVSRLPGPEAVRFLGGSPAAGPERWATYTGLRPALSPTAQRYWDRRHRAIEGGVLRSGVTERFIGLIVAVVRVAVHPPSRIRRLLACRTLADQRALYRQEWDSRRWRLLFQVLMNRAVFRRAYDPAFFAHVENPSFANHFYQLARHGLVDVAVTDNYFLQQMLTGYYPADVPGGLPPYLAGGTAAALAGAGGRLLVVDATYLDYLRSCADGTIAGFALSNICEWLDEADVDHLMAEIARAASPGARLVFRNFVGWTEVPERWREVIVEDRPRGDELIARDRSLMQRRIAVCRISKPAPPAPPAPPATPGALAREAGPEDNEALVELAAMCPMEGDIGLCVTRRPDFFALNRLEGDCWSVGVVDGPRGWPIGCIAVAERTVHLDGRPARTMYVSDLKVHPLYRGTGVADTLSAFALGKCLAAGASVPAFLTVLGGNRAMERRLETPGDLADMRRFATIRCHSVSLLWRRRPPAVDGFRVQRGRPEDFEAMADLWRKVAPGRQLSGVYDAASMAAWISAAPGLEPSSYWLARTVRGDLAGFVGLWDQSSFKQLKVTSYSPRLALVRSGLNAVSPLLGATPLPPTGGEIRSLNAVHVCVPGSSPAVLRALLVHAYNELRGQGYSFFTVGLDVRDPLTSALSGLLAQPTDVWACVATAGGPYSGPDLAARPTHHEIALV
jgi:S-adenosylmethionine-diacylglycerol 3-amino-3-carboxypropyl transferase